MTRATEKRIVKLMEDTYDTHPGSVYDCFRAIAPIIAADIDSRAARVETLMVHRREAIAAVHKARDERDEARAQIAALQVRAEAWDKLVEFRAADRNWLNAPETVIDAFEDFFVAAARANEVRL